MTLITFEEFERLYDGPEEIELLTGELIKMPPPQAGHMEIVHRLFRLLDAAVERLRQQSAGLGEVFIEMGYLFPGDPPSWLRPDVSVTRAPQPRQRFYEGAPLMVFEVVSENDTARQLESKVAEYLAHGASEVWVIYPEKRYAWRFQGSTQTATRETKAIRSSLLPDIEIPLDDIL